MYRLLPLSNAEMEKQKGYTWVDTFALLYLDPSTMLKAVGTMFKITAEKFSDFDQPDNAGRSDRPRSGLPAHGDFAGCRSGGEEREGSTGLGW